MLGEFLFHLVLSKPPKPTSSNRLNPTRQNSFGEYRKVAGTSSEDLYLSIYHIDLWALHHNSYSLHEKIGHKPMPVSRRQAWRRL
jgi:hypothetical protein